MSRNPPSSRFGALAKAVRDGAAAQASPNSPPDAGTPATAPGAGVHKPVAALGSFAEGLRERVTRLETELAQASGKNVDLEAQLAHARALDARAGAFAEEFVFIDPSAVQDVLPRDRLLDAFTGRAFEDLLRDVEANGQNDAITVRRSPGGERYEIAAGRRRLEACRRLRRQVLARVRNLDDAAMLRVQFAENERREDISALERAQWFAEVKEQLSLQAKDIAGQFGITPSTLSLYLRLARFPVSITERLREPRRLAVLKARRVMEATDADPLVVERIGRALDAYARACASRSAEVDPDEQIAVLMRTAEGRGGGLGARRASLPQRRHVVHDGQRIGTLTRNGGQWVFRFATALGDDVVQAFADRIGEVVARAQKKPRSGSSSPKG